MNMTFLTPKGNVFMVDDLNPFLIMLKQVDLTKKGMRNIQVNTNLGIRNITSKLTSFGCFDKNP